MLKKELNRKRRKIRIRSQISGTSERPRLSVFRSNKHIFLQLIDDTKSKTLVSASDTEVKKKENKTNIAKEVGMLLAAKASEKKITNIVFDRNGFRYHGRVKALAEGAREKGLKF